MDHTCNAIVKKADKRYICEKATGHARRSDPKHVQTVVTPTGGMMVFSWTDTAIGGESEREV